MGAKFLFWIRILALLVSVESFSGTQSQKANERVIPGSSNLIKWTGRILRAGTSVKFDWNCVTARFVASNTSHIKLRLVGGNHKFQFSWKNSTHNSTEMLPVNSDDNAVDVVILENANQLSKYQVIIIKVSGPYHYPKIAAPPTYCPELQQIRLSNKGELVNHNDWPENALNTQKSQGNPFYSSKWANLRLEVIGDSDTSGYCTTPGSRGKGIIDALDPFKFQSCLQSWVATIGETLGITDIHVEALAGSGVIKNLLTIPFFPDPQNLMTTLFKQALGTQIYPQWNFTSWQPHAVLIRLGSNDYQAFFGPPSNKDFIAKYTQFLGFIRSQYPDTTIIGMCGGVQRNDFCEPVKKAIEKSEGPIAFIKFPDTIAPYPKYQGCWQHTTGPGQRRLGEWLAKNETFLRALNESLTRDASLHALEH
mmetsp:Transcript_16643/g.25031  ORF Transcript_16643/g.25031 Transcript_16643/m.25031 type:complete len:422 (+) Transcript_16643:211-1476(+)